MAGKTQIFRQADTILTLQSAAAKAGRHLTEEDLDPIQKASMVVEGGKIAWIGPHAKLPKSFAKKTAREIEMKGRTLVPGFIECHTHTVFAGNRAEEFEMRLRGVAYQEIAARGGGILSTMKKTRAASVAELAKDAQARANKFVRQGVTTLEIKSGYALNSAGEMKVLQAAGKIQGPRVIRTFLGAHALPPEFKTYEEYLEHLAKDVLPVCKKKKLAERVDVFIEKGFFPLEASRRYLQTAKDLGFQTVIHADQLSLSGGSSLAVELASLSADHVIQVSAKEIRDLAHSEVTAVLLPAADLYMRCAYPPAREMIDAGVRVALATDFNPGTSPTQDLNLVGLLARLQMKMSLPEVIGAYTIGAAYALNLQKEVGSLEVGKCADFFSMTNEWSTLFYGVGDRLPERVFKEGAELKIEG